MDIGITWDNDEAHGDISVADADIVIDYGLTTAVIISLFSDSRVNDERGFWGDSLAEEGYELGSGRWALYRMTSSAGQDDVALAVQMDRRALSWMIPDYASSIGVEFDDDGKNVFETVRVNGVKTTNSEEYWEAQFGLKDSNT